MQAQEQESRGFSLSLWMDKQAAATAATDFVPLVALERHFAGRQPADAVVAPSPTQWAYLHRPVVPPVEGPAGAGA